MSDRAAHSAVGDFLREMYATLVDPVDAPASMSVAEMCAVLLDAARKGRQDASDLQALREREAEAGHCGGEDRRTADPACAFHCGELHGRMDEMQRAKVTDEMVETLQAKLGGYEPEDLKCADCRRNMVRGILEAALGARDGA